GGSNILYIITLSDGFKLVIRLPAPGGDERWDDVAARAMASQVSTLRLIAAKTKIPVPRVYDYDTTKDNVIGAPYMCMSFIPGRVLTEVWDDPELATPLEERRRRVLEALARSLAELAQLGGFNQIGSLQQGDGGEIIEAGPFDTERSYFEYYYERSEGAGRRAKDTIIKRTVLPKFPFPGSSGGFVLSHPDLDAQNVMVEEDGNLTGIIDWDFAHTAPRCVGYCKFPLFIAYDWVPLGVDSSTRELEQYRTHYRWALGAAMGGAGDWKFTKKSHIWEAFMYAAESSFKGVWVSVCRKLI
ncbi:kinase-like domain-containing protein, partial [Lasiosphaeris hirsuta]